MYLIAGFPFTVRWRGKQTIADSEDRSIEAINGRLILPFRRTGSHLLMMTFFHLCLGMPLKMDGMPMSQGSGLLVDHRTRGNGESEVCAPGPSGFSSRENASRFLLWAPALRLKQPGLRCSKFFRQRYEELVSSELEELTDPLLPVLSPV